MTPLPQPIEFDQRSPIYQQIVEMVLRAIASGALKPGEEIPSRRSLAVTAGINPMTVQKAFRMLEEDGVIETSPNARSTVSTAADLAVKVRQRLATEDSRQYIEGLRALGFDFREAVTLLGTLWAVEAEDV